MARPFRYSLDRRIVNRILIWLLKLGFAPSNYQLLTVTGRKTGKMHSVPVSLIEEEEKRWLVAPYGEVDWVKNARASGAVTISRGGESEQFALRSASPQEAAPVLRKYLVAFPITAPYFDARPDSPEEEFVAEAESRPVFELIHAAHGVASGSA